MTAVPGYVVDGMSGVGPPTFNGLVRSVRAIGGTWSFDLPADMAGA